MLRKNGQTAFPQLKSRLWLLPILIQKINWRILIILADAIRKRRINATDRGKPIDICARKVETKKLTFSLTGLCL